MTYSVCFLLVCLNNKGVHFLSHKDTAGDPGSNWSLFPWSSAFRFELGDASILWTGNNNIVKGEVKSIVSFQIPLFKDFVKT